MTIDLVGHYFAHIGHFNLLSYLGLNVGFVNKLTVTTSMSYLKTV